mmetsp:Transcript_21747/g.37433  ORF Transcript_21747/g.37433 Transcript_21747/m.37433 type:complete len:345 (+) Transcript_21747:224-1258(+)
MERLREEPAAFCSRYSGINGHFEHIHEGSDHIKRVLHAFLGGHSDLPDPVGHTIFGTNHFASLGLKVMHHGHMGVLLQLIHPCITIQDPRVWSIDANIRKEAHSGFRDERTNGDFQHRHDVLFNQINTPSKKITVPYIHPSHTSVHFYKPRPARGVLGLNMEHPVFEAQRQRGVACQLNHFILLLLRINGRTVASHLLEPRLPASPVIRNLGIHNLTFKQQNINIELITIIILFEHHLRALCPDRVFFHTHGADNLAIRLNRLRLVVHSGHTHTGSPKDRLENRRESDNVTTLFDVGFRVNLTKLGHRQSRLLHDLSCGVLVSSSVTRFDRVGLQTQCSSNTSS